jgi:hypothetical protein
MHILMVRKIPHGLERGKRKRGHKALIVQQNMACSKGHIDPKE